MASINQYFLRSVVSAEQMDFLWSQGWRHFGSYFFRYSSAARAGRINNVMPLRIDLNRFEPSRSQKRVMAKNREARVVIRDTFIDESKRGLFDRHRRRFTENVPDTLHDFLSEHAASQPCRNHEICVYDGDKLIAASFLDLGNEATSAVYAMFEPEESKRSLGIFTMLCAIDYSRGLGRRYYYSGYAYREPSVYDYKKNFAALEYLDWQTGWKPLPKNDKEHFNEQS